MAEQHQQSEVSIGLGLALSVELGNGDGDASPFPNVNPFEGRGGDLEACNHAGSESTPRATRAPAWVTCERCWLLTHRGPACSRCLASYLARKHGGPDPDPTDSVREFGAGRPGLPPAAAAGTRRALGDVRLPGAIARRTEDAGLKASPLRAAVGGAQ